MVISNVFKIHRKALPSPPSLSLQWPRLQITSGKRYFLKKCEDYSVFCTRDVRGTLAQRIARRSLWLLRKKEERRKRAFCSPIIRCIVFHRRYLEDRKPGRYEAKVNATSVKGGGTRWAEGLGADGETLNYLEPQLCRVSQFQVWRTVILDSINDPVARRSRIPFFPQNASLLFCLRSIKRFSCSCEWDISVSSFIYFLFPFHSAGVIVCSVTRKGGIIN